MILLLFKKFSFIESRLAMNSSVAPREGFFSRNVGKSMRIYSIAEAMQEIKRPITGVNN